MDGYALIRRGRVRARMVVLVISNGVVLGVFPYDDFGPSEGH